MLRKVYSDNYKELNYEIYKVSLVNEEDRICEHNSWLCGYVEVPKNHKLYGLYNDSYFDFIKCHGGITYSYGHREIRKGHYIGFDTAHYYSKEVCQDLEFCIDECKKIIDQLLEN